MSLRRRCTPTRSASTPSSCCARCGATEWATIRRVTLPLIAPGGAAGALLAFAISIDDFVITNPNAGQTSTFPLFIYGAARQGVPPQVNVLATALLLLVLALVFVNLAVQRRAARAQASAPPGLLPVGREA